MNHSHYLMLDDGTIRNYNIQDYRTRLVVHMSRVHHETDFPSKYSHSIGLCLFDERDIGSI